MTGDLRDHHWQSLSTAFMAWLHDQPQEIRGEVVASKRRGRVRLRFPRHPSLTGRIWNHCLAVYADDESGKYLLRIFDVDCLPIRLDTDVFACGFCEGAQKEFRDRVALWEHHLFAPFANWVACKLRQAEGVDHRCVKGVIQAELRMPEAWDVFDDLPIENSGVEHLRLYRTAPPVPKASRRW